MMVLKKEVEELRGELRVYKTTVTNGVMSGTPTSPIDVPKPKEFKGTRNAQYIENYIWEMEQYFQAANITEDTKKVKIASIYLTDFARLWWRRRCTDEKHGGTKVKTWEEFQEKLKANFYPVYAEEEVQSKLRQLKHTSNIRDYVWKFTELHLQILDMTEKQALFTFRGSLKLWAKAELQRRGVTELSKALTRWKPRSKSRRAPVGVKASFEKEAQDILSERVIRRPGHRPRHKYFVLQKGLPEAEGSWELSEDLWQFKDKIGKFHQQQAMRMSLNSVGENVTSDQPATELDAPKGAQTSTHHVAHDPRARFSSKQAPKEVMAKQNQAITSPIRPRDQDMEEISSFDPTHMERDQEMIYT
ncbi:hypothetical protein GQ457_03G013090 [Hibiscus cannabinus]